MSDAPVRLDQIKEEVEAKALRLRSALLDRQLSLVGAAEAVDPVNGQPVDFDRIFTYRGQPLIPIWGPETRNERPQTIRTIQQLTWARNVSRTLAETNPNAAGLLRGMVSYTVAGGSSVKVAAPDDSREPPVRLSAKVAAFLKKFRRANRWPGLEKEMEERLHKDGEFFLRLFPDEDNVTKVRFIEPAQVQAPAGADAEGEWSWGVLTEPGDTQTPKAYNVHDFATGEDETVEAIYVVHVKINVGRNQKRGVPSFWACDDELTGSQKLRYATREGEKVRASIAFFRQWATAGRSTIQALQDASFTDTLRQYPVGAGSGSAPHEVKVQKVQAGSVIDVPEGMEAKPPPQSPNSEAAGTSVDQSLMAVASRFQVPYWLVSGDPDATNFAASLTVESPFTKSIESDQGVLTEGQVDLHCRVMEIGVEQGQLPEDVLEQVEPCVEFPSPVVRNKAEETTRNQALNAAGLLSKATWSAREDLDWEHESANLRQEASEAPAPAPTPAPSPAPAAQYKRETQT